LLSSLTGQKVLKLGRIIAIDYGRKRTGLAVSDPLRLVSNNLKAISSSEIFDFLADYFSREKVDIIVVGYPRKLNNQPSESVLYVEPFIKKLGKIFPDKEIVLMDERFTSKIAFKSMIEGNLKKKKRRDKGLIDTISANLILQSYLDYNRNLNG
jgi:putative Holliday junction resolvase